MTIESSPYQLESSDSEEPTEKRAAAARGTKSQAHRRTSEQDDSQIVLADTYHLSVVVPTRNELDNIWPLLESLQRALRGLRVEVIFVDDSDDDTTKVIADLERTMSSPLFHMQLEHRLAGEARAGGLATAVVQGLNKARATYVAVMDADLQHPPEQLRGFYEQAVAQDADLVIASRYITGGSNRGLGGVGRRCVSVGLKWTARLLFPRQLFRLSDPLSGFFLLRRSLLAGVSLRPIGYKILLEILLRCPWRKVLEVPYHFQARASGQSKARLQQGLLVLRHMRRLWREVPAAGRVWKISLLVLLNILITPGLFMLNELFPWVGANLNILVFLVMVCLDFVLLNRFIFPSPAVASNIESSLPAFISNEDVETIELPPPHNGATNGHHLYSIEDLETIELPHDDSSRSASNAQQGQSKEKAASHHNPGAPHASNGASQKEGHNGAVISTTAQSWRIYSHEIDVKMGFPGDEPWAAGASPSNSQGITIPTTPAVDADIDERAEVIRYAEWLTAEAKRNNNGSHQEESKKYVEDALRTITVKSQEFRLFAPFRHALSASKTLTRGQKVILSTIMLVCALGLLFYGMKLVTVIIAIITLLYFSSLLLDFLLAMLALNQSTDEQIDDALVHALTDADWPRYTILCPLYREAEVVPQFVQAMQALDYPADKLQILFLTEEDDVETRKVIKAMHLPRHFSIVTVPAGQPRTKPRACNFGLLQATGDYLVIYDAEDIPDPLQLKKAVLTFANHGPDLACVQAKLNYYNTRQNLLTRWFTVEYSLWFDLMLPGMQQTKLPLPLGGTSNHFRTAMLRSIGAWDPFNVTEDCDLGLRLARSGLKSIVLDSTTYEEANSQVKNWIRQRSRWIKGYLLTYLVYMRQPLRYLRQRRLREFLSLQLVIGGKAAVLFVNPLMWALLAIYILFRPVVGGVYHTLFPGPVLYMGTLCLIFGNFLYLYSHLVGCMKRSQYGLIKWALFIPIYWAMMSIAASLALFQLIFKPHYWEKTKHGLHLHTSGSSAASTTMEEESESEATRQLLASTSTKRAPLLLLASGSSSGSTTVTRDIEPTVSLLLAASRNTGRLSERRPKHPRQWWLRDPWLTATFVVACIASIASCWYFFQHHELLLYNDAISHLRIARRVFDNITPGLAQLGGVWLPLPQLLMLPFVWNDYLWHTGFAGSFPAMLCYLVAVVYLFLAARRLTHDSRASFVGTLLFILNPNILYLQTIALSEIVCIVTSVMACYYFLAWTQDNHPKHLVGVAAGTFLATLSRFDGWGLLLVLFVLIVVVMLIKRLHRVQIEGVLILFCSLGALGIGLWILWDVIIFGDPLYWHHYLYGSDLATRYYTYHHLWQSVSVYMLLSLETVGPILFVLAAIATIVFVLRRRLAPDMLGAMTFLTPFVFYLLILYFGQDTIFLPGIGPANTSHYLWNVRFGAEIVAPAALFLATLAEGRSISIPVRIRPLIGQIVLVLAIVIQTILTASGGIISLQDGQYGESCTPVEPITAYLAQHYDGGRILEDEDAFRIAESEAGIDLKNTIYEGSTGLWKQALNDPASMVEWIIVPSAVPNDPIAKHIPFASPAFLSKFTLVVGQLDQFRLRLYHRNGRSPLPTRPMPSSLLADHRLCSASSF